MVFRRPVVHLKRWWAVKADFNFNRSYLLNKGSVQKEESFKKWTFFANWRNEVIYNVIIFQKFFAQGSKNHDMVGDSAL